MTDMQGILDYIEECEQNKTQEQIEFDKQVEEAMKDIEITIEFSEKGGE